MFFKRKKEKKREKWWCLKNPWQTLSRINKGLWTSKNANASRIIRDRLRVGFDIAAVLAISLPAYFKVSNDRISIAYEKQKKDSYSYKIQLKDKNITSKISGNRKYEKLLLDSK